MVSVPTIKCKEAGIVVRIQVITLRQLIAAIAAVVLVIALLVYALCAFLKKDDGSVYPNTPAANCSMETQSVSASGQALAARSDARGGKSAQIGYLARKLPEWVRLFFGFDPTDAQSIIAHALPGAKIACDASIAGFISDEHAQQAHISPSVSLQIEQLEQSLKLTPRSALLSDLPDAQGARVFVYHSHTTEAYADSVCPAGSWRCSDDTQNVIRIGDVLCQNLAACGVTPSHSSVYHENPNYNYAYPESLKTLRAQYASFPQTALFIDLHRDAWIEGSSRPRAVQADGVSCAQLQFVIGVGTDDTPIPHWKQNYEYAARITAALEEIAPGITRPVRSVAAKYNQFVAPGCILVEVGHNQNTLAEAEHAMKYLAEAIASVLGQA